MRSWRRSGEHLVAVFDAQEAAVVRGLVGQIKDMLTERAEQAPRDELSLLTGIRTGPTRPPDDPVMARLLPDFHRPDDDGILDTEAANSAAALRSLHEPELLDAKTGVAGVLLDTCPPEGGTVRLSDEQAQAWVSAINDVRLALGTALDITEDMPEELPMDDPRAPHYGVYQWLTWVQESLVQALSGGR